MINPDLKNAFRWHMQNAVYRRGVYEYPEGRAAYCLALARNDVASGKRRYPASLRPHPAVTRGGDNPNLIYLASDNAPGFRRVGRVMADTPRGDIWDKRESSGWYTSPYGESDMLCHGVVYQLPGRNGESRFVAGYQFTDCDGGPTLDLTRVYAEPAAEYVPYNPKTNSGGYWNWTDDASNTDAARTAAYAADSMAQHAAEQEREYQTAWAAGSRYADESHDVQVNRAFLRDILKERREVKGRADYPALCKALRAQVADLLRDIAKGREAMRELSEGDFRDLCFWTGEERLRAAFCEGAGLDKFPA